jgi:hypothetical protein
VTSIEYDYVVGELGGQRALYVLPVASEHMPSAIREGITRRRLAVLHGRCPCGGRKDLNRAARRALARKHKVTYWGFQHEDGCPAVDDVLLEALRAWSS